VASIAHCAVPFVTSHWAPLRVDHGDVAITQLAALARGHHTVPGRVPLLGAAVGGSIDVAALRLPRALEVQDGMIVRVGVAAVVARNGGVDTSPAIRVFDAWDGVVGVLDVVAATIAAGRIRAGFSNLFLTQVLGLLFGGRAAHQAKLGVVVFACRPIVHHLRGFPGAALRDVTTGAACQGPDLVHVNITSRVSGDIETQLCHRAQSGSHTGTHGLRL